MLDLTPTVWWPYQLTEWFVCLEYQRTILFGIVIMRLGHNASWHDSTTAYSTWEIWIDFELVLLLSYYHMHRLHVAQRYHMNGFHD
jgi:hypothetical protein